MRRVPSLLLFLLLLAGCSVKSYPVTTIGMEPTVIAGSRVLVNTSYYRKNPVRRFDLVVVKEPDEWTKDSIRRVVGLGGETLQIQSGKVLVNGKELKETFSFISSSKNFGPITIPEGRFFVMGDNRPAAYDSTGWREPTIGKDDMAGKVIKIVGEK